MIKSTQRRLHAVPGAISADPNQATPGELKRARDGWRAIERCKAALNLAAAQQDVLLQSITEAHDVPGDWGLNLETGRLQPRPQEQVPQQPPAPPPPLLP